MPLTLLNSYRLRIATTTLALASLAGCKHAPTAVDDTTLTNNVHAALAGDASIANEPIQPTVSDGSVTLNGNVSNDTARQVAAQDAAKVVGVKQVINNLTVQGAQLAPTITTPAAPAQPRAATPQERQRIDRHEPLPPASNGYNSAPVESAPPPQQVAQQPPPPPPAPVFRDLSVPPGTGVSVRINDALDSGVTQEGAAFSGTLTSPIVVAGEVAVPAGASVSGRVVQVHDAGHFSGNSLLSVQLVGINRRGEHIAVNTEPYTLEGKGRGKNTAEKVGGGAAVGAILGGIFGGGKGAAIGAGAGGGLGAGANAVTRGQQVRINPEDIVRFRLSSGFTVRSLGPADRDHDHDHDHDGGGLQQRPPQ